MPGTTSKAMPASCERERLLAAAAEDERVAALQPHHRRVHPAELDEPAVDRLLRHGVLAGPLARVHALRPIGGERDDARVGQPVVHERVRSLDQLASADGEKAGIAGARPDQVDRHRATHPRRRRASPSCQAYAATGTLQPPPTLWANSRSASTACRVGP